MRLLLDEDIAVGVAAMLRARDVDAAHVLELKWRSRKDPDVLSSAIGEGFDALITKDRHRDVRRFSLQAMRSGLRIVLLRISKGDADGIETQFSAIYREIAAIEEITQPHSVVRQLIIRTGSRQTQRRTLEEVEATMRERGWLID